MTKNTINLSTMSSATPFKLFVASIIMLTASSMSFAQSTCISRCEAEIGLGDSRCPEICKGVPDKPKSRKKADGNASAASASASAAASGSAVAAKKESAEVKDAKAAFESGQAAGK